MQTTEKVLLKDYPDEEKGAYLGAIASLATADHSASGEEIEHLESLAEAAGISESQKQSVIRAATELSDQELKRCLEILKHSDLKFSLMTDLISFAESDSSYSGEEKKSIEQIAKHLDISREQFSLLDQFVQKSTEAGVQPADVEKPGFLASLGLQDRFQQAGISWKKIMPGLLGVAAPLLLSGLFRRRNNRGMSSMFNPAMNRGGIGSMISGLSGGRGLGNVTQMLSGLLGRR